MTGPGDERHRTEDSDVCNDDRGRERRRGGFSLIEIMAVVTVMLLLIGLVSVAVTGQIDKARVATTQAQLKQVESALAFYQMDNGRFPTSEQGLDALVRKPALAPEPRNYRPDGYLAGGQVPRDAWGNPYQYESPGQINTRSYDLWSYGADGQAGGEGQDADIGNWAADPQAR
jgi:general secretion pathway protein G